MTKAKEIDRFNPLTPTTCYLEGKGHIDLLHATCLDHWLREQLFKHLRRDGGLAPHRRDGVKDLSEVPDSFVHIDSAATPIKALGVDLAKRAKLRYFLHSLTRLLD